MDLLLLLLIPIHPASRRGIRIIKDPIKCRLELIIRVLVDLSDKADSDIMLDCVHLGIVKPRCQFQLVSWFRWVNADGCVQ